MIWVRSLLFAAVFYAVSTVAAIAMTPLLLAPRRWIVVAIGLWARVVMAFLRVICDVKVEVRGRRFMPTGPARLMVVEYCKYLAIFAREAFLSLGPKDEPEEEKA